MLAMCALFVFLPVFNLTPKVGQTNMAEISGGVNGRIHNSLHHPLDANENQHVFGECFCIR